MKKLSEDLSTDTAWWPGSWPNECREYMERLGFKTRWDSVALQRGIRGTIYHFLKDRKVRGRRITGAQIMDAGEEDRAELLLWFAVVLAGNVRGGRVREAMQKMRSERPECIEKICKSVNGHLSGGGSLATCHFDSGVTPVGPDVALGCSSIEAMRVLTGAAEDEDGEENPEASPSSELPVRTRVIDGLQAGGASG